ncbi:MAG TPA: hypothetical protein VGM47_00555 [Gammaproteobacteria bacterium]
MKRLALVFFLSLVVSLAGCSVRDSGGEPLTLKADIPAAGLQHLVFQSPAGEARISASPDDAVHVKLSLQQEEKRLLGIRLPSDATTKDMEAAKLGQDRKGDALTLSAVFPSGDDHNEDVKQVWEIQVPARFSVDATMKEGRLVIRDLSGGIDANLSAGDLSIYALSGPVRAKVRAGRLHVISDSTQPGAVSLASTFGLAALDMQGKYYGPPEQHGGFRMFGNSISQDAGGKDDMQLSVTFGLVDLRVGPQGDEKEYRSLFTDDKDQDKD